MSANSVGQKSRVYFAQATWGGPIKIGWSYTVEQRIKTLAGPLPFDLVEIGSFLGNRFQECFLHSLFAEHRIRGEWFAPVPDVWRAALECRTHGDLDWVPRTEISKCLHAYADFQRLLSIYRIPVAEFIDAAGIDQNTFNLRSRLNHRASVTWLAALAVGAYRRGQQIGFDDISMGPVLRDEAAA